MLRYYGITLSSVKVEYLDRYELFCLPVDAAHLVIGKTRGCNSKELPFVDSRKGAGSDLLEFLVGVIIHLWV